MAQLLLVKHAAPEILREVPSSEWDLSEEGSRQCESLHRRLAEYRPGAVFTSHEPKAASTAAILSSRLDLAATTWPGLQENDRTGLPFFDDIREFEARMEAFFVRNSENVVGSETADEAHDRFVGAVRSALASAPPRVASVVVAHGTVISLLVGRANRVDPYSIWRSLEFTSFAVVDAASFRLERVVHPPL